MRIVFMGTPSFAVPSLEMLVKEGYEIAAVVTQPDRPKGRGNKLTPPPVKDCAQKYGIKVLQPEKLKGTVFLEELRQIAPDLMVTAAYGKILPADVLAVPRMGCVNVHGSLLPRYRGAAPIQWAVINGESVTGITTMLTDIGMDTGDMLLKSEIPIDNEITYGELYDRLSLLGAEVLKETLKRLENSTLERIPQNAADATYAPMINKEVGLIDWARTSQQVHNLVRGTDPWPGAYTFYNGDRMRVWKTQVLDGKYGGPLPPQKTSALLEGNPLPVVPGTIVHVDKDGPVVATESGFIKILELQFDSGKRMPASEYLRGHRLEEGVILI